MDVTVKIMLVGGHQYQISLPSDSPILKRLFQVVFDISQNHESAKNQLFQLPCFPSARIVSFVGKQVAGIITEPALLIQPIEDYIIGDANLFQTPQIKSKIIPAKFLQIDNFLPLK